MKSIPIAVGQSTNAISSSLNTLTTEQEEIKEQLTNFLKTDLPNLLSKIAEDMGEEFKTSIDGVDKIKNNQQEMFKIELWHINESLQNNTWTIIEEIHQLGSSLLQLSLTDPSTSTSSQYIHESMIFPISSS